MSTLSQFAQTGKIKSIQRGVISVPAYSTTASVTITSVDTSKSILYYLGQGTQPSYNFGYQTNADYYLTLANSTTITANGGPYGSGYYGSYVSWQLVEYY